MRFSSLCAALAAAALALPLAAAPAQAAAAKPKVKIIRIYFDSPGSDRGGNRSVNAEYIRIKNYGKTAVSLDGWTVRDDAWRYTFDGFTLRAGKTVTLRSGRGKDTSTTLYWGRRWYVWNNDKDVAYLRDAAGKLIDSCSYTRRSAKYRPYVNC